MSKKFVKGANVKVNETRYGNIYNFGINKERFMENPDNNGWVNFSLKTSKEGKPYLELYIKD